MFDACICLDDMEPDYDQWLLADRIAKARQTYECGECHALIQKGKQYRYEQYVRDGRIDTHRTCLPCSRVRDSLFQCGFWYGGIWEEIHERYCDGDFCLCPDPGDFSQDP